MLPEQINHRSDIKELRNDDYEVEIVGNFLLVHNVPYLNAKKNLVHGTLVSNVSNPKPHTHVAYFIGETPHDINGLPMKELINNSRRSDLGNGIVIDHLFSHKPTPMYSTEFDKITTYIKILSSQAQHFYPNATARTGKVIESEDSNSVLQYSDTNSARAEIDGINEKLAGLKIGIIGLGGTGSYILDKVAKTHVGEIHLFDGDNFKQHNAFRAPGATTKEKIDLNSFKVDYFKEVYSQMHKHIVAHSMFLNETNFGLLNNMDFVFIAIDTGEIKKELFKKIEKIEIPFIDCGLGVEREGNQLLGIVRTTLSTPKKREHMHNGLVSFAKDDNKDYSSNIQIADLNDLNAILAVIKWKKFYGFYNDQRVEYDSNYSINVNTIFNNDLPT